MIVCGNWNNGSLAGPWARNLNNYRSNSNNSVGFRADYGSSLEALAGMVESQGCALLRYAKSWCTRFSGNMATAPIERQAD